MKFPETKYNLKDRVLFYAYGEKTDINLRIGVVQNIKIHTWDKKVTIYYEFQGYTCTEDSVVRIFNK